MDEANKNGDKTEQRDESGRWIKNGPGRPKGLKNKFTKIKEELTDLWADGLMREKLEKLLDDPKEAKEILKIMVSMMPKEDIGEDSSTKPPIQININGSPVDPGPTA